jgi:hypothetical protein
VEDLKMAIRLVALALLLGCSAAPAFDSTKVGQWGSLYLDDLSPILAESAQLKQEVTAALAEKNKKPEDILCFGMRFPGAWKKLGGTRVAPYTCDFNGKYLRIDGTIRVTGHGGRSFETINDTAMKRATDVSEENLTWKWTTGDDPAKGPPWSVRFASTWTPIEDDTAFLDVVKDSANQIELYLDFAAKTGRKPDFSGPPVSDLFARVFDLGKLAALPPPKGSDVPVLLAWISSANGVAKAIMYFGITPPADRIVDQEAIKRNLKDFEDQQAAAFNFLIRITAREVQSTFLFMENLAPEQRTPVREKGFDKARVGGEEMIYGALVAMTQGFSPANARLISAALRDTRDAWALDTFPKDRPLILNALAQTQKAATDDEVQKNLAAFADTLAAAK